MNINPLSSCMAQELTYISSHATPAAVLEEFCKRYFLPVANPYNNKQPTEVKARFTAFYIFTAVLRDMDVVRNYGPAFADFLRSNNFGIVTETPETYNPLYHKEHIVKVYVWQPNAETIVQWWNARRPTGAPLVTI